MARMSRLAVAGHPHHLFQRGNDRTALFRDDADRERYLDCLREAAAAAKVALHAYVLMDDHVHLLATPAGAEGLSRMMQALGRNYVGWFNHRHQRSGTLWEGRFRSSLIEADSWLLPCMRYIELNPVRAGITVDAPAYRWSSARHHLGQGTDALLTDHALFWSLGQHALRSRGGVAGLPRATGGGRRGAADHGVLPARLGAGIRRLSGADARGGGTTTRAGQARATTQA